MSMNQDRRPLDVDDVNLGAGVEDTDEEVEQDIDEGVEEVEEEVLTGEARIVPVGDATPGLDADRPLLADADGYRERWKAIQSGFVDEPLYAVESAGRLLSEVLGELASTFATKRNELEAQWRHRDDTSTEDLRQAFRAYRSFFDRVVST